jgi:nucleotide-binding universal stress UspA family protein
MRTAANDEPQGIEPAMSEEAPTIRRILAAVDASPGSLGALRGAADLAARLDAELLGLYVEDVTLLQLANLPVAREVRTFSATVRELDIHRARRLIDAQSGRVHRAIRTVASERQVTWTYRVRRGPVANELIAGMSEADLIVLGRASRPGRRRLGSTASAVLEGTTRPVLLLDRPLPAGPTALVLYDGSERGEHTLALATRIVEQLGGYLAIVCLADDSQTARLHQQAAFDRLADLSRRALCRWLIGPSLPALLEVIATEEADLLALPGRPSLLGEDTLRRLIEAVDIPILLVR